MGKEMNDSEGTPQKKSDREKHTVFCTSCGAEFDDTLACCPYCQTLNYKGAEAEYLRKLEEVREDLDDLQEVPEGEIKKEVKKQTALVWKIAGIFAFVLLAFFLIRKAEDLSFWYEMKQNEKCIQKWSGLYEEEMEALYEQDKYEEMTQLYDASFAEDAYPSVLWKHYEFMECCEHIAIAREYIETEEEKGSLSEGAYANLFHYEWEAMYEDDAQISRLTEKEKEYIQKIRKPLEQDFEKRWQLSDSKMEELQQAEASNYGILSYDTIKEYIKSWYENREETEK